VFWPRFGSVGSIFDLPIGQIATFSTVHHGPAGPPRSHENGASLRLFSHQAVGVLRTSPFRNSRKSTCEMRHRRTGDTAQGHAAPTFALNGDAACEGPPLPSSCYQSTSPPRRKRPFAANAKVVGALERVTISSSRACLYPPSKAARPSSCSRPGPVRCLSYVRHGYRVISRT
jgi:hypothetical protein